jgi:hypothetical protein
LQITSFRQLRRSPLIPQNLNLLALYLMTEHR